MLLAAVRGAANVRCARSTQAASRQAARGENVAPGKTRPWIIIELADQKARKGGRARICGGCGTMVVKAGEPSRVLAARRRRGGRRIGVAYQGGALLDVLDSNGFLCERCKALRHGNVWHLLGTRGP